MIRLKSQFQILPLFAILLITAPVFAEDESDESDFKPSVEIPRQGEYGGSTKWYRYPYEIESDYPYLKNLPPPEKIPELIELIAKAESTGKQAAGAEVAKTQLSCLARVAFFKDAMETKSDVDSWRKWWREVGADYFRRLEKEGIRNENAWHSLVGFSKIPCPEYKILLPKEWRFEVSFRTGDYMGVVNEVITMERSKDKAVLKRRFSPATDKPFQYEVWNGGFGGKFSPKDADDFLCELIYAIDHPWFVKRFVSPRRNFVEGRSWRHYYSHTDWTGVVLPDGRVWVNDDPWNWKESKGGVGSMDIQFKTVYPLLCRRYRDRAIGWVPDPDAPKDKTPPMRTPKSNGGVK